MQPQDLEPEFEELALRIVPGLAHEWRGATSAQIAQIEHIAGRPLPRFYRWFLRRMGDSMGPLAYPTLDFSAAKILSCYGEGMFEADPRFLLIGYERDEVMPLHVVYDFGHGARNDALVTKRHAVGGDLYDQFETFREMIAWGTFLRFKVVKLPQRCSGLLVAPPESGVLDRLDPVMRSLGFARPIASGPCCSLYEGPSASMVTNCSPGISGIHAFTIGGNDAGRLRRILGDIGSETELELEIDEWTPPIDS